MDYRSLNIMGAVRIAPMSSLAETAAKLGVALGVILTEDPSGEFDEFPSFSAECAGLSFVLLGIPEPEDQVSLEPIGGYTLQIGMAFRTKGATETCDASAYFTDLIRQRSDLTPVDV
jgi:hypothetical protein